MQTQTAGFHIQRSGQRARFDFGWLQTYHSFSFAEYFDPDNVSWGALRVFNDDTIAPGKGFGEHPHRDMEILTYVFAGELEHRDSMGNVGVVKAGGVQYLSAGTGITHSESNHSAEAPLHLVQMWVMPRAPGLKPRYGQVDFQPEQRANVWLPIASGRKGVTSEIEILQDAAAFVARLDGGALTHSLEAGRLAFLFAGAGAFVANGEALAAGDAMRVTGPYELDVRGTGELVLWDVPPFGRLG